MKIHKRALCNILRENDFIDAICNDVYLNSNRQAIMFERNIILIMNAKVLYGCFLELTNYYIFVYFYIGIGGERSEVNNHKFLLIF